MKTASACLFACLLACAQVSAQTPAGVATPPAAASSPAPGNAPFLVAAGLPKEIVWHSVMGADGSVDIVACLGANSGPRHIHVSAEGPASNEPIPVSGPIRSLDAAFDRQGRLHAYVNEQHLLRDADGWRSAGPTPWARVGIAGEGLFVPGARDLTWAFTVQGKDIDVKGYWGLVGAGGPGGGIILPWHFQTRKLILAPDDASGPGDWTVLDRELRPGALASFGGDLAHFPLGDANGNIHVFYARLRFATVTGARYAVIPPLEKVAAAAPAAGEKPVLRAVDGRPLTFFAAGMQYIGGSVPILPRFAIDRSSGEGIVFNSELTHVLGVDQQETTYPTIPTTLRPLVVGPGRAGAYPVLATGKDRVGGHKLTPLVWLSFQGGNWTEPVDIDRSYVTSHRDGWPLRAPQLAGDGGPRVLVTWRGAEGLMGRWMPMPAAGNPPANR